MTEEKQQAEDGMEHDLEHEARPSVSSSDAVELLEDYPTVERDDEKRITDLEGKVRTLESTLAKTAELLRIEHLDRQAWRIHFSEVLGQLTLTKVALARHAIEERRHIDARAPVPGEIGAAEAR